MARCVWLLLLLKVHHFQQAAVAEVITQPKVQATVGMDARLSCSLARPPEVNVQVTWQKQHASDWDNMATHSHIHGVRVRPPYMKNVAFAADSRLWNSSIVVRNVSREDATCYRCLFSGHLDGTLTALTCLIVSEPHEFTPPTPDPRHNLPWSPDPTETGTRHNAVAVDDSLAPKDPRARTAIGVVVIILVIAGAVVVVINYRRNRRLETT